MIGVLSLFKSRWVWLGLLFVGLIAMSYGAYRNAVNLELENQRAQQQILQMQTTIRNINYANHRLMVDVQTMTNLNTRLSEQRQAAELALHAYQNAVGDLMEAVSAAETPEERSVVVQRVQSVLVESYACLESATGVENPRCKR